MYGLWRKRLLLPEGLREELTPDELRHVLLHELAHIKRRDPELNCLAGGAANPALVQPGALVRLRPDARGP